MIQKLIKKMWAGYLVAGVSAVLLSACHFRPVDRGQQYHDGEFEQPLSLVNHPDARGKPVNREDFSRQLDAIRQASMTLYNNQSGLYHQVTDWLQAGGDTRQLSQYHLQAWQMQGVDSYGNVQFTGYYTPVVQARVKRQGEFQYPIYRQPASRKRLPSRRQIHAGAINNQYILAYSNSLIDNFIMGVQGSGYVDFADGNPPTFFSYGGKNGHPYRSIGKVLIEWGEMTLQEVSMQAIRHWAATHSESQVRELLEQNPSYVFFKPQGDVPVKGASAVPLIQQASVASDITLVPPGSVLLAEVPLLDNQGKFTGQYQLRMMVALDVGGAIKGQHLDIYQGIGDDAGHRAGWLNHYGRVWLLKSVASGG